MPVEGGGRGDAGPEGCGSGRLGAAPARTAQTAKVRSLLGPLSGASHSRVPCLRIPRKGRVSGFCHRSFCNHGNGPPRRPPPPKATAPVLPLTGLPGTQPLSPGPHHLPGWQNSHLTPRNLQTQPWRGGPRRCALYPKICFL